MKYVISDLGEVNMGYDYHFELAGNFKGQVVGAGHCEIDEDGKITVFGSSTGFHISAKESDRDILDTYLKGKK